MNRWMKRLRRVRVLARELTIAERIVAGLLVANAHLRDDRANLRRELAEGRGERQQLLVALAHQRELAAKEANRADEAWALVVARGKQLRANGLVPSDVQGWVG
jgi:hypothetical protein